MKKLLILFGAVFFLLMAVPVLAEEVINDYSVTIEINEDGSVDVAEKITYDFGTAEKHGIYRDIPYKYKARGGTFKLRFDDFMVVDEKGNELMHKVLNKGDDKSLKIGDPDKTVTGANTYVISYTVRQAINFFEDHDEFYWNVTGNGWKAGIKQSKATVKLPGAVKESDLKTECFAGPLGGIEKCVSSRYKYSGQDMVESIVFINDKLNSWEGMTVVVGWPPGMVKKPTVKDLIIFFIKDNGILGLPVIVFFIIFMLWRKLGRDPSGRGTIIDETEHKKDVSTDYGKISHK